MASASIDKATVTLGSTSGENGSTFTFTVSVTSGYEIFSVKVNGDPVTAGDDGTTYTGTIAGPTTVSVETKEKGAADPKVETLEFVEANRESQDTSQQTWKYGAVKLVNEKAESTSNVGDFKNPARFYKSSSIEISCVGMTKIVFKCNSASYATALGNSISGDNLTVSVSGKEVTITFSSKVNSFEIAKLSAQVRVDSIDVYYFAE